MNGEEDVKHDDACWWQFVRNSARLVRAIEAPEADPARNNPALQRSGRQGPPPLRHAPLRTTAPKTTNDVGSRPGAAEPEHP